VLSRYAERPIQPGADGQYHRVVELAQLVERDGFADVDVAVEVNEVLQGRALELLCDLLRALVVGSDARPDQPEGRRQTLDDVDTNVVGFVQQRLCRVEASRPGPNDRDRDRHC
jgi:hypothetical protein